MLHKPEIRRQFEPYVLLRYPALSECGHFAAKVLLVPLAGEAMGVIGNVTHKIDAPAFDGVNLIVTFHVDCPLAVEIVVYENQVPGERRFVRRQQNDVVRIAIVIPDFELLFYEVVEFRKIEVCEKLAQIVADRNPGGGADNLVEQPKQLGVFDFYPNNLF